MLVWITVDGRAVPARPIPEMNDHFATPWLPWGYFYAGY
jgi:hypothetical protein